MDVKSYKTNATSVSFTVEGKSNELGQVIMAGQMKDGTFVALQQPDGSGNVVFSGVSEGVSVINRMIGTDYSVMLDLMTRAVNNRTRQRNYFQLQSSMLEGLISEDEFYKRIEENEDDYDNKNVNDDVYDDVENDDILDNVIHHDGREYTYGDDMAISKNADNTIKFTDYDHGTQGVSEVVGQDGNQFIVVFWAKNSSGLDSAKLMSMLNDFNKNNNVSPVTF